ncbi:MAG TPA: DUF1223 domain-containing protein [Candidatus Acidoferrum sp.]
MVFSNRKATLIARPGQVFVRPNLPLRVRPFRVRRELLGICLILAFLLAISAARSGTQLAAADNEFTTSVLVELFTSEGCSSCPPADALLEKLDALQPIPGTQLVVLSEHVDYWNHDGWTDPFSSASFTDRQSAYVRALGLKTPFTPQFLVDGTDELKTHDTEQIVELLRKAGAVTKLPMRLASVAVEPGNPAIVRGRVESDVNAEKRRADVYLAIALDHAESQVSRGENNGRHLVHVAVVTEFTRVGKLETGKGFGQDFRVKLKLPRPAPMNLRIVAFAQESGPGKVLGVVMKSVGVN